MYFWQNFNIKNIKHECTEISGTEQVLYITQIRSTASCSSDLNYFTLFFSFPITTFFLGYSELFVLWPKGTAALSEAILLPGKCLYGLRRWVDGSDTKANQHF